MLLSSLVLIVRNCGRNRRRTILTVISVAVSMCLLGVMVSMYHAFYWSNPTPNQARRMVVRNRVAITTPLPDAYEAVIRNRPGVSEVMMSKWFGGTYRDNRDARNQFPRFMVEPDKLFAIFGEFRIPEDQREAFVKDRTGCVIGRDLASALQFRINDKIVLRGDIFPGNYELTIRGIFDSPSASNVLYFNKEYVEQSPQARSGAVSTGTVFYVLMDDASSGPRLADSIDQQFRNSTAETRTESEQAFLVSFISLMGNVRLFLAAISGALVFAVLAICSNTVAMAVRERLREVAVLKAIGFTPGRIVSLLVGEATTLAFTGGVLGFLGTASLLQMVASSPYRGYLPPVDPLAPVPALICLFAGAAIGIGSSLTVAVRAARMSIVSGLKNTD